ncbi:hypothetical protein EJD97_006868 [Solanum chilense]|uniref:Uncharacterized protein n=1 Tax=Solanum chilense TaxID=4083 RepID=A0A6N2BPR8_SOLCI|nr:hypothetical protein EJD97_006868 [Solanum chilense]
MAEVLDQKQMIDSLRREKNYLLMKIDILEATHKLVLEARKLEIWFLKQKLDEVDNTVKFYSGVLGALERENIDLKLKLEEENQLIRAYVLLNTMEIELLKKKNKLVKIQIKELEAKVAERRINGRSTIIRFLKVLLARTNKLVQNLL